MIRVIIDYLNTVLASLQFADKIYGLVEQKEQDAQKSYPVFYSGSRKEEIVLDLHKFQSVIYHRQLGQIVPTYAEKQKTWSDPTWLYVFPMRTVAWVRNQNLGEDSYTGQRLSENLVKALEVTYSEGLRTLIQATHVRVQITNSVVGWDDVSEEEVRAEAWKNTGEWTAALVDYEIRIQIRKSCLDACSDVVIPAFDLCGLMDNASAAEIVTCIENQSQAKQDAITDAFCDNEFCELFTAATVTEIETCFDTQSSSRQDDIQAAICDPCPDIDDFTCAQLNHASTGLSQAQRDFIQKAIPLKTGQTTVYQANDDGTYQKGRQTSLLVLTCNNPNGNTSRLESTDGGLTVTDWATGRMWSANFLSPDITWVAAIAAAEASVLAGYTDWRLPNIREYMSILNFNEASMFNYAPFNIIANTLWSSTTVASLTTSAWCGGGAIGINSADKLTTQFYMIVRDL